MKDTLFDSLDFSDINEQIHYNPADYIRVCDREYRSFVKKVANSIAADDNNKIVMLSGPSGSGKTTTAHFIEKYINDLGKKAVTVSLDNFYLGKNDLPKLPDGRCDYETIYALNIEEMISCLKGLIRDGHCDMPEFDFLTGSPKAEKVPLSLPEDGIAVFEGIHALNSMILDELPAKNIFKVYVSVKDGIYDGKNLLLSPREIRLSRRMIRDKNFRNSDVKNTLHMWTGVVMGEEKYLFPFKDTADISINSLHPFEAAIYRDQMLEMLATVEPGDENFSVAAEMYGDYMKIAPASRELLPEGSLIHEFVG